MVFGFLTDLRVLFQVFQVFTAFEEILGFFLRLSFEDQWGQFQTAVQPEDGQYLHVGQQGVILLENADDVSVQLGKVVLLDRLFDVLFDFFDCVWVWVSLFVIFHSFLV